MIIKEFGKHSNKSIILLHGGGLSWWSLKSIIEILESDYHIITPIIDGHGEDANTIFTSIENMSDKLIEYIKECCNKKVYAICGLSIGAQIIVDILSKEQDICDYAIIESALIKPIKALNIYSKFNKIFYPLSKTRWFAKLQAKALFIPKNYFNLYYEDICKMKYESLENITISNGSYKLKNNKIKTNTKVMILVGEKEIKLMKESAKELNNIIENSFLKIISECGHGELSLRKPREYCKVFYNLID